MLKFESYTTFGKTALAPTYESYVIEDVRLKDGVNQFYLFFSSAQGGQRTLLSSGFESYDDGEALAEAHYRELLAPLVFKTTGPSDWAAYHIPYNTTYKIKELFVYDQNLMKSGSVFLLTCDMEGLITGFVGTFGSQLVAEKEAQAHARSR